MNGKRYFDVLHNTLDMDVAPKLYAIAVLRVLFDLTSNKKKDRKALELGKHA